MAQRNLFYGCSGSDVKTLQKQLKSLGYYKTGSVDGSFGPLTQTAVKQFQRAAKILVDGVVGPQTRAALSKALAAKKKKKKTTAKKKTTKKTTTSTKAGRWRTYGKADATIPRKATVAIDYDPTGKGTKNTRNAKEMAKYLESFTYSDPANGESDAASIELCNISMIWANKWLPKKGDKFTANVQAYNWDSSGANKQLTCGTFCCDDRNFSFPGNSTATINGTSVPEKQAFRSTKRSKTWKNITIREIARRIAKRYKLKLSYTASTIKVKSMKQTDKEDCSFLKDLCSEYGLYIKVYRGQIVIYDAARFEAKKAVATIDYSEVISGDYNSTLAGTYTGATIKYTKGSDKKEYTYKVGSGNRILAINEKVDSLSDAKIKAKAQLAEENRKAETIKLTIAAAGKELYSSGCFTFKNAYEMSGKYFIDKVTHKVDAGGGYTIEIEAHKVPTSKTTAKKTAKKTTTKTKNKKKKASTSIKAGDRVRVNGNAYYAGNGGRYNVCRNMTMYVTQVLGGNYKYQYGVAKRKGGSRYGWCAKSSLKKI